MNPTFQQLKQKLSSELRGLNSAQTQLRLKGDPSSWTIQQVVEHLLLTYDSTASSFQTRLAKGTPTLTRPTPAHRTAQFVVITLGLMPGRRKAPPEVTPSTSAAALSGEQLIQSVSETIARLNAVIQQAENSFVRQRCLSHFALGPLTVDQWRRFHLSHGHHHIRQIAAIRRTHGL